MIGSALGETITALAGDDTIEAEAGDDLILAGDGADEILGGDGTDTVSFAGSDVAVRGDLAARIGQGGHAQGDVFTGIEALIGSDWNDTLAGDLGANRIEGRAGRDLIEGRAGADSLFGEAGNDTLLAAPGRMPSTAAKGRTWRLMPGRARLCRCRWRRHCHGGDAEGDVLSGIEDLTGSDFADALGGDAGANLLSGGAGADTLEGGAGADTLEGGAGADVLRGGAGVDVAAYTLSSTGVGIDLADSAAAAAMRRATVSRTSRSSWDRSMTTPCAATAPTTYCAAAAARMSLTGATAMTLPITPTR